ncbi:MAG: glycine--tRNA ligase subunit beta [Candidatus Westeberhardia cardiocondylae]|nr:glycine--tRNA ligase subunit beta [Candidatus Westeberhardia cardiocondylae]
MKKYTFLMEIGTEELPPKILQPLAENFSKQFIKKLLATNIQYKKITWLASPRRIAIQIKKITLKKNTTNKTNKTIQKQKKNKKTQNTNTSNTPNIQNTYNTNNSKTTTNKNNTQIHKTFFNVTQKTLNNTKTFKCMQWGENNIQFIRPIHTITLLINKTLITGEILGTKINRIIYGHRFMGKQTIIINHAKNYQNILYKYGKVIADYQYRKKTIEKHITKKIQKIHGNIEKDNIFLNEITSLVEWPIILLAKFNEKFLKLPQEILIHIIKNLQKCFPIFNNTGKILPYFIIVTNIKSKKPQKIISGYEQSIQTHLQDTIYFLKKDKKLKLIEYLPKLKQIKFNTNIGNLYDKTNRIQLLATWISKKIHANIEQTRRAAKLSKCDLITNMVTEFPNVQGIIGMYYAKLDNEPQEVYLAQKEQYQPKSFQDNLPTTLTSCSIAIADKIDTLTGMFIINQIPKTKHDPFSLKRITIGILRIITEKKLPINLQKLIQKSTKLYQNHTNYNPETEYKILHFIFNRFTSLYQKKGYTFDVIQSVLSKKPIYPADIDERIRALTYFKKINKAKQIITIYKRITNILKKSNNNIHQYNLQQIQYKTTEEIQLKKYLITLQKKIKPLLKSWKYQEILSELTTLHDPINTFFKNIMILTKNEETRQKRLILLKNIQEIFFNIADITLLK